MLSDWSVDEDVHRLLYDEQDSYERFTVSCDSDNNYDNCDNSDEDDNDSKSDMAEISTSVILTYFAQLCDLYRCIV